MLVLISCLICLVGYLFEQSSKVRENSETRTGTTPEPVLSLQDGTSLFEMRPEGRL